VRKSFVIGIFLATVVALGVWTSGGQRPTRRASEQRAPVADAGAGPAAAGRPTIEADAGAGPATAGRHTILLAPLALGQPPDDGDVFEVPRDRQAIVEEYSAEWLEGCPAPSRRPPLFIFDRGTIPIETDPSEPPTILWPGRYRVIPFCGGRAKTRFVYRLDMLWEAPPYLVRRNCEQFPRAPECIGLPTREVTIVPMGPRVPEELDGLAAFLEPRFPGLTFRVAPLSNLPEGVLNGSGQVVGERLGPWIPDGSVVVIEKDLKMEGFNFIYSFVERGFIGIVSVSRFRTKLGMPAREGAQLKPGALGLSRKRQTDTIPMNPRSTNE